ncbi:MULTISPECIES: PadR family transcriptional regulator [Thermomonospora]|uniref:Transcriptional regulator, PadR-like family n=1 Tax=Thermomonospora curvata (strain ATCC 19995 / DSM 43183 / JCM 3096 / KCTC 9072 / NBRC 15933 / NCIMB 10081 / Henssen B9) TaxID=471852 RepID=D1AEL4_THECD|nr:MULTISPECIES: PadR family transcriptional regulator [Thermomonospora]ACY95830.1 transcriptional regulator, PadR-like family [Thermomonospora curvata DSM 43183]PKK16082.1 MAG: PadR family transcriptional regulator [Thermomonospora sp. CIF 1]
MSLRMAVLGLLAGLGPASGYDLTQRFDASLAFVWYAQHSQIYPELNRLAAEGLIEVAQEGPRGRKTYAITPAGREAVTRWLQHAEPAPTRRNEGALRAFLLPLLDPAEAVKVLQREAAFYAERVRELQNLRGLADSAPHRFGRHALELGIRQMTAIREWAEWAAQDLAGGTEEVAEKTPESSESAER